MLLIVVLAGFSQNISHIEQSKQCNCKGSESTQLLIISESRFDPCKHDHPRSTLNYNPVGQNPLFLITAKSAIILISPINSVRSVGYKQQSDEDECKFDEDEVQRESIA